MSSTKVDIANGALAHCGETGIKSFEDKTKGAKLIKDRYESTRVEVLRRHPWKSVFSRKLLSPKTSKPAFGQTFAYAYPSDALRIWYVVTMEAFGSTGTITSAPPSTVLSSTIEIAGQDKTWAQVGSEILSHHADIGVAYVRDEPNTRVYDALLVSVIELKLAFNICFALTQDRDLKKDLFTYFIEALAKAKSVDAKQEAPRGMRADAWAEISHTPSAVPPFLGLA